MHRIDFERGTGATQHHFSDPLPEEQARELALKWENIGSLPRKDKGLVESIRVAVESYKPHRNYDDKKLRKVTYKNIEYQWKSNGRTVTIYKNGGQIFTYTGDPHDRIRNGVLGIIKEKKL